MAGLSSTGGTNAYQAYQTYYQSEKKTGAVEEAKQETKTSEVNYGKTIGEPKLSEKAQKYYEKLRKKFGNYDFILVSEDQKANAQANASKYANKNKTVVLIDEDKIERMATDESYRKKYEGILSGATSQMQQLQAGLSQSGARVQGYGMQVNDGGTLSFFAVLKKSSASQKARMEKTAEKKRADRKEAEKKAERKAKDNRKVKEEQESSGIHSKESVEDESTKVNAEDEFGTITISAGSLEELMQKINDYTFEERSNQVQTEGEKAVGQHINFRG